MAHIGKYELLERLGDGGMAEVYRARLPGIEGFERIVVIKRVLPHLVWQKPVVAMFVAEAKLAAQIHHKNIVQVHALERTDDGEYFMVMEYIQGLDLRRLLRSAAQKNLRIPPWFSVHVMCEVLDGLAFVHALKNDAGQVRGVVHRDVTPSNVFISDLGEVKLGDFGVAKDGAKESETRPGQLKGKVAYMSPEQLNSRDVDQTTDVFSAGVVLWECLTQRRLFGGRSAYESMTQIMRGERKPPSSLANDVPRELDSIVLDALQADRTNRLNSAQALQERLLEILPRLKASINALEVRKMVDHITQGTTRWAGEVSLDDVIQSEVRHQAFDRASDGFEAAPQSLSLEEPTTTDGAPASPPDVARPAGAKQGSQKGSDTAFNLSFAVREADTTIDSTLEQAFAESLQAPEPDDVEDEGASVLDAPSWLISGSEMNQHDSLFNPQDNHRWQGYQRHADRYDGSPPFHIKGQANITVGPLSWDDFMEIAQSEVRLDVADQILASHDGQAWMPFDRFVSLLGWEALLRTEDASMPPSARLVGDLLHDNLITLLFQLGVEQANGQLRFVSRKSTWIMHTEIHLSKGRVMHVSTDRPNLQMPEALREKGLVKAKQLPGFFHRVLQEQVALETLAGAGTAVASVRLRAMVMKERIFEVATWTAGQVWVDAQAPTQEEGGVVAESLVSLLLELATRMQDSLQIDAVMTPAMKVRPRRTEYFDAVIERLRLNPAQRSLAEAIGKKKLASVAKGRFAKSAIVMAYVLQHVGALQAPSH